MGGIIYCQVWRSENGDDWSLITSSPGWCGRHAHTSVVFDNKMWIFGGSDTIMKKMNDVWYSGDGVSWTCATDSAPWTKRSMHTSVVYDNKMWVLGGNSDNKILGDAWYSTDGRNWTCATDSAPWARFGHTALTFDGKMWVIGGSSGLEFHNDAWFSTDGKTWNSGPDTAPWQDRVLLTSVVFDDKIWVIAGENDTAGVLNDVWYTPGLTGIVKKQGTPGDRTVSLERMYPNPFHASVAITFRLQKPSTVTLSLYTCAGRVVRTFRCGAMVAGTHVVVWDGTSASGSAVPEGIYYLRIDAAHTRITEKIVKNR